MDYMSCNVGKTMPFLPPMTGNDNHTTYKNGDDWGIVYYCFNHIILVVLNTILFQFRAVLNTRSSKTFSAPPDPASSQTWLEKRWDMAGFDDNQF